MIWLDANKEYLKALRDDDEVERILKELVKLLENKHLNPWTLFSK